MACAPIRHRSLILIKKRLLSQMIAASCIGLFAVGAQAAQVLAPDDDEPDLVPSGKGWGERATPTPGWVTQGNNGNGNAGIKPARTSGISYHGGPVMTGTVSTYFIWYGNWAGNSATSILADLATHIGSSPYFNINKSYYNSANVHVSGATQPGASGYDNYSKGTALTDANIQAIVAAQISSNALPKDPTGVYFVLTSADVNATSGFCTQYCGWHTHGTILGTDIKYSFVGNPDRCPSACAAQAVGPNGNAGADGMASIIAHELEEAVTDPDLNAWYDRQGAENADKCAWTFGTTSTGSNGALYNVTLGSRNYLIQRNWSAATQACGMQ